MPISALIVLVGGAAGNVDVGWLRRVPQQNQSLLTTRRAKAARA
jgi:hypothetical protein